MSMLGRPAQAGTGERFLASQGRKLSIIADPAETSERAAINERVVGFYLARRGGHGFTELLAGTIPGLMGC